MVEMEYTTLRAENGAMFEKALNDTLRANHGWELVSSGMSMRTMHPRGSCDTQIEVWWAILGRELPEWKKDMV